VVFILVNVCFLNPLKHLGLGRDAI